MNGFLYHKVAPWSQNRPELAKKLPKSSKQSHFPLWQATGQVLHRQPTTLFSLNGPTWVKLLGLKRRFLHHNMAHRSQKGPELAKRTPKSPQNGSILHPKCGLEQCIFSTSISCWFYVDLRAHWVPQGGGKVTPKMTKIILRPTLDPPRRPDEATRGSQEP